MMSDDGTLMQRAEASRAWVLGWTRWDCCVFAIVDQIILSSLCHPSLNFTFTPNWWAHFVVMLLDIAHIIRLSSHERKALEQRHHGLFRKHLGEGYYVIVMYHSGRLVLDFRQHCALCGLGNSKRSSISPTKSGISINLQDEWEDLLNKAIPGIHHNYPKFADVLPRCRCLYGDDRCYLGWKALLSVWTSRH